MILFRRTNILRRERMQQRASSWLDNSKECESLDMTILGCT